MIRRSVKHTTISTVKFLRLVSRLRPFLGNTDVAAETVAVGLLERLWQTTAKNAPAGNIGKLSDDEIAAQCGWFKSPEDLLAILLDGWIDRDVEHRLVIHDWAEHCPNYVRANLSKHDKVFADGRSPKGKKKEGVNGGNGSLGIVPKDKSLGTVPLAPSHQTKPNQTKPVSVESSPKIPTETGTGPSALGSDAREGHRPTRTGKTHKPQEHARGDAMTPDEMAAGLARAEVMRQMKREKVSLDEAEINRRVELLLRSHDP